MGRSEAVSTRKDNNVLIGQSHAVEDFTKVRHALVGVGETAIWGAVGLGNILAAKAKWNLGSSSKLDSSDRGELDKVGKADFVELLTGCNDEQQLMHDGK